VENVGHTSQLPPTLMQELSLLVQRMPAWLFALLSLAGIFVLYQFVGGGLLLLLFGLKLTESDVAAFRWATMVGQILFLLLPTLFLAKLRFPHRKNVFRFGSFHGKEIVLIVLAIVSLQQLMQGYLMLQESIPVEVPPWLREIINQLKEMMEEMTRQLTSARSLPEFLFVVLVIAATPAVCEELLFRGLVQQTLERSGDPTVRDPRQRGLFAAVVTGLIFAFYHINPFTLVPLAVLGVYLGFLVYRTQNILSSMVAHFINNFLACLAVYLRLDDNALAVAPTATPTATLVAVNFGLCTVVFVAATYYLVRITNNVEPPEHMPA